MKYKVGDIVKIVPMDYPSNRYWRQFAGRVGVVVDLGGRSKYGYSFIVGFADNPDSPEQFFIGELVAATDVDILAYKLGATL